MREVQYTFDGVGNRMSVDDNATVMSYTVNDLNQYTSVAGLALTYSTNGNLVGAPGFALTYDAQNRLVQAAAATGTVTFAYDGRNRVVRRTVTPTGEAGTSVWFVWGHAQSGQWGLLEERDASGDLAARYVHGERIDEILRREGPEGTLFYHHDALGSTVALTDGTGALVEQYRYDVFGQPSVFDATGQPLAASAAGNRFLFTGREWLAELGLYDYRNRVYSPALGRWLQPDPIGLAAGDGNLYRYCRNGCLQGADALGLAQIDLNLTRQGDPLRDTVSRMPELTEVFSVLAHGTPGGRNAADQRRAKDVNLDAKALAALIRESGWNGEPIKLYVCESGKGGKSSLAKALARELRAVVLAPREMWWAVEWPAIRGRPGMAAKDVLYGSVVAPRAPDGGADFSRKVNNGRSDGFDVFDWTE